MKTLIVPDLHHDLPFLGRIMEAEASDADLAVFLGDYFDSFKPQSSAKRVCRTLADLMRRGQRGDGPLCTFLVGNHDLQYVSLWRTHRNRPTAIPREASAVPFGCSGYSKSRAQDVCRYADPEWLEALQMVTTVPGARGEPAWLLSHAGVPSALFRVRSRGGEGDMLRLLREDAAQALHSAHIDRDQPWFWCGPDRGGSDPYSGPLWQDWERSFRDDLPWRQIVGHTAARGEARQRGDSWCLDGAQTIYGVITDGLLEVRTAPPA